MDKSTVQNLKMKNDKQEQAHYALPPQEEQRLKDTWRARSADRLGLHWLHMLGAFADSFAFKVLAKRLGLYTAV